MRINDYSCTYHTTLGDSFNNTNLTCLLDRLLKQRGQGDEFICKAIKDLCSLSLKDEVIAKYLYELPPPSWMYARYIDWFGEFINDMKGANEKLMPSQVNNSPYYQGKIEATNKAGNKFQKWREQIFDKKQEEELKQIEAKQAE